MKSSIAVAVLCAFVLLLTGCRSDFYCQAQAVERARTFLLENARELSPEQVYYVKFNDPVLLHAPVIGEQKFSDLHEHLTSEQRQICVYWTIPGAPTGYLVFGVSGSRMQFWRPVRLIRKNFVNLSLPLDAAMAQARAYAMNSLFYAFDRTDFNRVRFFPPMVAETDFKLNFNPGGRVSEEEQERAREIAAHGTQLSLIWKLPSGSNAVFCGVGRPDLGGWKINFGGIYDDDALKPYMKKILKTPAQANTPIVVSAPKAKEKGK